MKCQNCAKNEVNFHYSSNVNGTVTEAHLCSECAKKAGYDFSGAFNTRSMFDDFFPASMMSLLENQSRLMPIRMPTYIISSLLPFAMQPRIAIRPVGQPAMQPGTQPDAQQGECSCGGECGAPAAEPAPSTEVDSEMQKRCEINAIREQMRIAAAKEDFEKAAELRDKIKEIEL